MRSGIIHLFPFMKLQHRILVAFCCIAMILETCYVEDLVEMGTQTELLVA